jgi:hypothetical protein
MPESGYQNYDFDQEPVPQRGDYLVRVPRGAIRHLEAKAKALDALKEAGVLDDLASQASAPPSDTPLEPGEAGMTSERRSLAAHAPPDIVQPGDSYTEMERVFNAELAAGRQEKHAAGVGLNYLVNRANAGDQRVLVRDPRQQYRS